MTKTAIQRLYEIHTELVHRINNGKDTVDLNGSDQDLVISTLSNADSLLIKKIAEIEAVNINDIYIKLKMLDECESLKDYLKHDPVLIWPHLATGALKDAKTFSNTEIQQ